MGGALASFPTMSGGIGSAKVCASAARHGYWWPQTFVETPLRAGMAVVPERLGEER